VTEYPVSEPIPAKLLEVDTSGLVVPVEVCTPGRDLGRGRMRQYLLLVHRLVLLLRWCDRGGLARPGRATAASVVVHRRAGNQRTAGARPGPRRAGRPAGSPPEPRAPSSTARTPRRAPQRRARPFPGAGWVWSVAQNILSGQPGITRPWWERRDVHAKVRACSQSGTWQRSRSAARAARSPQPDLLNLYQKLMRVLPSRRYTRRLPCNGLRNPPPARAGIAPLRPRCRHPARRRPRDEPAPQCVPCRAPVALRQDTHKSGGVSCHREQQPRAFPTIALTPQIRFLAPAAAAEQRGCRQRGARVSPLPRDPANSYRHTQDSTNRSAGPREALIHTTALTKSRLVPAPPAEATARSQGRTAHAIQAPFTPRSLSVRRRRERPTRFPAHAPLSGRPPFRAATASASAARVGRKLMPRIRVRIKPVALLIAASALVAARRRRRSQPPAPQPARR